MEASKIKIRLLGKHWGDVLHEVDIPFEEVRDINFIRWNDRWFLFECGDNDNTYLEFFPVSDEVYENTTESKASIEI